MTIYELQQSVINERDYCDAVPERTASQALEYILSLISRMKKNNSRCTPEQLKLGWYNATCNGCKWEGVSEMLGGGGAIADTGDYNDATCPYCGSTDINEL